MNTPKKSDAAAQSIVLNSIEKPSVVSLSWRLCDAQGELLDELLEPVDFLIGADDLLPAIEDALLGQNFLQHFEVQLLRDRMVLKPHR